MYFYSTIKIINFSEKLYSPSLPQKISKHTIAVGNNSNSSHCPLTTIALRCRHKITTLVSRCVVLCAQFCRTHL
jgi:hypothetical protein